MNIFDAFRTLSQAPEVLDAIARLEEGYLPAQEAKQLAWQVWLALKPIPPAGQTIYRHSAWGKLDEAYVWKGLYDHKPERAASTIRLHCRGGVPPKAVFVKAQAVPQPKPMSFVNY